MTTIMKSEPTPSDREVLTGLVERVAHQDAENDFYVRGKVAEPLFSGVGR